MIHDLLMFDLDGTLVDSAPEYADATNAVLRSRGLRPAPDAEVGGWIGNGAREIVIHALAARTGCDIADVRADHEDVDAAMAVFRPAYSECCGRRSDIFPNVRETLDELRRRGVAMALVTNKEAYLTARVLTVHRLLGYFDPVVGGDSLSRRKPDPLPLEHCMQVHGVERSHSLLIGDSPIDVAAARAAGVPCWAVPYGYACGRPIADVRPDRILASFAEVLQAVDPGIEPVSRRSTCPVS